MGVLGVILIAQTAAASTPPPAGGAKPDIEIHARADIRSLTLRSQGEARLTLRADPDEAPPVQVERSLPPGQTQYRNLRIELHGIARLAPPQPIAAIKMTTTGDIE